MKSGHVQIVLIGALMAFSSCSGGDSIELPPPGPGVIFSYPFDGQKDVPTGARIIVSFSDPVDQAVLDQSCGGIGSGGFCVVGPGGAIAGSASIAGAEGKVIHFESDELVPGETYGVHVSPSILAGDEPANNLPPAGALFSFQTRQDMPKLGEPPVVWAINGQEPGSELFPFLDFSTVRILVSEPLDVDTVILGDTFEFVEILGDIERRVSGSLLVDGTHITFDPDDDLRPRGLYRLRLSSRIRDTGGESMADEEIDFTPVNTRTDDGEVLVQTLNTQPGVGDEAFPAISSVMGDTINSIRLSSTLIGETSIDVRDANLQAVMGNPALRPDLIPLTIRKGQLIASTGLDVHLGGEIPADLWTGNITVRFISDASGFVVRNPFRAPEINPDDAQAPLFVYLTFDAAISASDVIGNSVLNQSMLGVQVAGVAAIRDGALFIETAGTLEMDLLGVAKAPANMVLSLATTDLGVPVQSDQLPPGLYVAYPFDGQDNFPTRDNLLLIFSEPVDLRAQDADIELLDENGAQIDVLIKSTGSTLVVTPRSPLDYDQPYSLRINAAWDMAGNLIISNVLDATGGDGTIEFRTPVQSGDDPTPPLLTSIYPGVPCALTDVTEEQAGRCEGGNDEDEPYAPFALPANRSITATFDKPIQQNSLTLGPACGSGSVRVEHMDGAGACLESVAGTLVKRERGLTFTPNEPWQVGEPYRLVLISGTNSSCGNGEICATNGQPFNPDALNGSEGGDGGGPTMIASYVGAPATEDTFVPTATFPFTDVNGNGFVDPGEIPRDENRAALVVTDTTGVIPGVSIPNDCIPSTPEEEGCMYISASMPVSMEEVQSNCTIGTDDDGNPIVVDTCVPVRIFPQIIYGTSVTMELLSLLDIETGRTVLRMREDLDEPSRGYVIEDPETDAPKLIASLAVYMDAPDMSIPLAGHDLESKPLTISISGPIAFEADGRMKISASNDQDIDVRVEIDFIGLGLGGIELRIPAGAMRLQLMSQPLKGTKR